MTVIVDVRNRIGRWMRVRTRAAGGPEARRLLRAAQAALDGLGTGEMLTPALRRYTRRCCTAERLPLYGLLVFLFIGFYAALIASRLVDRLGSVFGIPNFYVLLSYPADRYIPNEWLLALVVEGGVVGGVALSLATRGTNFFLRFTLGSSRGGYLTLSALLSAIAACADEDAETSEVEHWLHQAIGHLRKAHRWRNTVPMFSRRHGKLKRHAALVVAALLAAEGRLDVDPIAARVELARLLHKIAERFVASRIGAMLDEDDLGGLQAAHNWEPLRLATLVVSLPAMTWLPTLLGLPGASRLAATTAGIVITAGLLYGRRWADALARAKSALSGGGTEL
jgi:hypothetical protein